MLFLKLLLLSVPAHQGSLKPGSFKLICFYKNISFLLDVHASLAVALATLFPLLVGYLVMLCNRPAPRVERGGQKFCWYIGRKSLVRGSTNKSGVKKLGEMSERSKKLVRGAKNLVRGSTGPTGTKPF